jgi:glycosyltransferase involved in cell wall biosynthesis
VPLLYCYLDAARAIKIVSDTYLISNKYSPHKVEVSEEVYKNKERLIGTKLENPQIINSSTKKLKVAFICGWNQPCGISTYSKFLVDALAPKIDELKIFSEFSPDCAKEDKYDVVSCWRRGQSLTQLSREVIQWEPSVSIIEHEWGIFPVANFFLPFIESLKNAEIPLITTLHSVYEHLDKSVCTSALKNIVVHSKEAKQCLEKLGHKNKRICVISHGCVDYGKVDRLWNFFGVPYPILQIGFGFNYKGVDVALKAIAYLKEKNKEKYKDIFYIYLCSENPNSKNIHEKYYLKLKKLVDELSLQDNVAIQRGFLSDDEINNYFRTARLAIFPYVTDPQNIVYGASGATRLSFANNTPTIASSSHMFDDLEGVIPRPEAGNVEELANEIDRIFSDEKYKQNILEKQRKYILENLWEITADRYKSFMQEVLSH